MAKHIYELLWKPSWISIQDYVIRDAIKVNETYRGSWVCVFGGETRYTFVGETHHLASEAISGFINGQITMTIWFGSWGAVYRSERTHHQNSSCYTFFSPGQWNENTKNQNTLCSCFFYSQFNRNWSMAKPSIQELQNQEIKWKLWNT